MEWNVIYDPFHLSSDISDRSDIRFLPPTSKPPSLQIDLSTTYLWQLNWYYVCCSITYWWRSTTWYLETRMKCPILIGPTLIHGSKTFDFYLIFTMLPHGNGKNFRSKTPYVRRIKSTLEVAKEFSKVHIPKMECTECWMKSVTNEFGKLFKCCLMVMVRISSQKPPYLRRIKSTLEVAKELHQ